MDTEEREKEAKVHAVFENIYDKYDVMNSVISFKKHIRWRKDAMKEMSVEKGAKALDLCCGTGDWSFSLSDAVGKNGSVIGLDFSENMLSIAKKRQAEHDEEQLIFMHGNAMDLPFPDESFDYVTIGFGLRNVPNYVQVLKEMYRVLKPGGKAVCLETSQPTIPVFRQLYYFYFRFIMPTLGKVFAKSFKEYAWLHESAKDFPNRNELKKLFLHAGFDHVDVKSYTGGVAALHIGHK